MLHQGYSISRQITAIRNTRGKETECFSSFCSLKILFKWYFCYYNLSTVKPSQGVNFWGSSQVLWVFPRNVRNDQSLTKIFLRLQTRLDHLKRIVKRTYWKDYVSRLDLLLSFLSSRKKMETLPMCWSFLIGLTKVHALIGKVKNALRIIEKHCDAFKVFKLVKNAFHSLAAVTRASRGPILQCVTLL